MSIIEPVYILGLSLNETCLKEGSDISIRCNIKGFPRPNIEFRKNDAEIASEEGLFQNILIEFYDQVGIILATEYDSLHLNLGMRILNCMAFHIDLLNYI